MIKHLFTFFTLILFSVMSFSSCSDDEENDLNGTLIVNGTNCEVDYANCSFHGKITDEGEEIEIAAGGGFELLFIFEESMHRLEFSINGLSSPDKINIGENYISSNKVSVSGFRDISSIEFDSRFYDEDGSLSISERGSNYVIVDFKDFSFIKDTGKSETKYTFNGKVKFVDINS